MLKSRIALAVIALLLLPGCFFRKNKTAAAKFPPAPVRIVLLPLNIPQGNTDLKWVSLAVMIQGAKELEDAVDLEVVPIWEGIPAALETLGASRSITPEVAADTAIRANARWAIQGELSPSKDGLSLLIDFIPRKASDIPFRYQHDIRVESLSAHLREAFEQFLRYLVARPLARRQRTGLDSARLKEITDAVDKEYGWFGSQEAGRAQKAFSTLAAGDNRLARLVFNPAVYAASTARPETAKPVAPGATSPAQTAPAQTSPEPARIEPAPAPQQNTTPPAPQPRGESAGIPATTPEVRPPATKVPNPPQPAPRTGGYFIQILSTRNKGEAEKRAEKLSKAGHRVEVSEVDLQDKGIWFRVRIQGFETREAAQQTAKKLVAEGLITEYWISP
jgi:cell division septation protein DedD